MTKKQIVISKDFTDSPGARYRSDGAYSGQEFYEEILKPKLSDVWGTKEHIIIDFDNTLGYASSFISEVFLRVVRDFKDRDMIKQKILIKSEDDPFLEDAILQAIDQQVDEESSEI